MLNLIHWFDEKAFTLFLSWRIAWLDNIFLVITMLGKSYVVIIITILLIFYFWKKRDWEYIIPLILSVAGSSATALILKLFIARPRPVGVAVYIEDLSSFPSGHATVAVALYGFLAYFIYKKWFGVRRWLGLIGMLIIIILIGLSRIYLGVHYFSDVVGGYLVGGLWLVGSIIYLKKTNK